MTFRPRIRTLKPEMWADEKVGSLSRDARLLFVGLITMADDHGRLRAMPAAILGHVFPYDTDAMRKLQGWIDELAVAGLAVPYTHAGHSYMVLPGFEKHQVVNRKKDSSLPEPPPPFADSRTGEITDSSVTNHGNGRADDVPAHGAFSASYARGGSGSGTEGNG